MSKSIKKNKGHVGTKGMSESVQPLTLKQANNLMDEMVKHRNGKEMATVFMMSMSLLLRVSDVVKLKYFDVFTPKGVVKNKIDTNDIKTNKTNILQLKDISDTLYSYRSWLLTNNIKSKWLFPAITNHSRQLSKGYYYNFIKWCADYIGYDHVGTHTARKTGALALYKSTHYRIDLIMSLLNHTDAKSTLHYLGLSSQQKTHAIHSLADMIRHAK